MNRIAIHSVPRSGSSWLGQLFNSSPHVAYRFQPLFSYAFKGRLDNASNRSDIIQFFSDIAASDDGFLNQLEAIEKGTYPRFDKQGWPQFCVYKEVRYHHIIQNLLQQDPEIRVVGLVRNPLSVLASWKNAPKEFRPGWDFGKEWKTGESKNQSRAEDFFGFLKWKEVATNFLAFQKQFPQQFHLVEYAELLDDTESTVRAAFEFCGIPWNQQTQRFIRNSCQTDQADVYSVFKAKSHDDAWTRTLEQPIVNEVINDLKGTQLERFCRDAANLTNR